MGAKKVTFARLGTSLVKDTLSCSIIVVRPTQVDPT